MKINEKRYYCFGCQVKGDAVDFVSKYYGLSLYDAAKKICEDFNLAYDINYNDSNSPPVKLKSVKSDEQRFKEIELRCFNTLCQTLYLMYADIPIVAIKREPE